MISEFNFGTPIDEKESWTRASAPRRPGPTRNGEAVRPATSAPKTDPAPISTRTGGGDEPADAPSFAAIEPRFGLEKLVLPESTRLDLQLALDRIRNHPVIYREWGLGEVDPCGARVIVSLTGKPGTGKTTTAEALAKELGRPFLPADGAALQSRYPGGTSRNIRSLFEQAERTGAALFLDEADTLLSRRLGDVSNSADHAVNAARSTLLLEFERFDGVIILASNFTAHYDPAFKSRITLEVELPLPDAAGRAELWNRSVPPRIPGRARIDWTAIAARSEGFAGREVRNAALLAAVRVAGRSGDARQLTADDLLQVIELVRKKESI
jgi:AAA+ superfamily predicted ATPase